MTNSIQKIKFKNFTFFFLFCLKSCLLRIFHAADHLHFHQFINSLDLDTPQIIHGGNPVYTATTSTKTSSAHPQFHIQISIIAVIYNKITDVVQIAPQCKMMEIHQVYRAVILPPRRALAKREVDLVVIL